MERDGIDPVIQEFVEGEEYIVSLLYGKDGSRILSTAYRVYDKKWDFLGNIWRIKTINDKILIDQAEHIGDQLDVKGAQIKLLFKRSSSEDYTLIGASPLLVELQSAATAAGQNYAKAIGELMTGELTEPENNYEAGVQTVRNTIYRSVKQGELL
jgi:hypothetical protein